MPPDGGLTFHPRLVTVRLMTALPFHASCVALPADLGGVLIMGSAQSGKSSLALQLLSHGAKLVSDDQTLIQSGAQGLVASAPPGVQGLLEIVGYGIVRLPPEQLAASALLRLVVILVPMAEALERMPEETQHPVMGVKLPRLWLRPHDPAAVVKIMAVLRYPLTDHSDG